MSETGYVIVNFGGPRSLSEIESFLTALLTDPDVISTPLPLFIQNIFFRRIAKKRVEKIAHDYAAIGGKSPIFDDTEAVACKLRGLFTHVYTFHRYLLATHQDTLCALESFKGERLIVFPMFPQFSYSTTGSIARFFKKHLSDSTLRKLLWVKSYPIHPEFIALFQRRIAHFLQKEGLEEENTLLLCSSHGLPLTFIEKGDPYALECQSSFSAVMQAFPKAQALLAYQSKFGRGEWLKPYTEDVCKKVEKKNTLVIPLSFTSDHIETLFEIEKLYLPLLAENSIPYRLPAFNQDPHWIDAIAAILKECFSFATTEMLIRK